MKCIKCGKEIPEGELFCTECSLNSAAPLFSEGGTGERYPAPKGRMQTPVPVKRAAPQPMGPRQPDRKPGSGRAVKIALAIVSLLLAAAVGVGAWQYGNLGVQQNRLLSKEADLTVRERELDDLNAQIAELQAQLDAAEASIADRDLKIQDLQAQLTGSQSSQSQSEYDLTTKQTELDRLEEENQQLLEMADALEAQIDELTETQKTMEAALEAAAGAKAKADFMDTYVVFVEDDHTSYYHTYDCSEFSKKTFWAYSRKLAEANGYKPCPVCGGKP